MSENLNLKSLEKKAWTSYFQDGLLDIFFAIAYFMDFNRLYIYGVLFAVGAVLWELFGIPAGPVAIIVSGSVGLATGLSYFAKFLRDYPKPVTEVSA